MTKQCKSATQMSVAQMEKPMETPSITAGLHLGDRFSHYCRLTRVVEVVESGRNQTTEAALRGCFEGEPTMRLAPECGTHSPWIRRLLEQLGHQVANTRKIRARRGKKRAIVAVARKLAVVLHRKRQTGNRWQPFPNP